MAFGRGGGVWDPQKMLQKWASKLASQKDCSKQFVLISELERALLKREPSVWKFQQKFPRLLCKLLYKLAKIVQFRQLCALISTLHEVTSSSNTKSAADVWAWKREEGRERRRRVLTGMCFRLERLVVRCVHSVGGLLEIAVENQR